MTDGLSGRDRSVLDLLLPPSENAHKEAVVYRRHRCSDEELEAVRLAEHGNAQDAVGRLDALIEQYPHIASLHNNRAQCLRLQGQDARAEEDLQRCLALLCTAGDEDALTARQANEQLGWLLFRDGRLEAAERHFREAARLGSADAQRMAVRCNPYAELCNAMFREAMAPYFFVKPQ